MLQIIVMAAQILVAWGIGLFGGHLLVAALGGAFGMVLLPIAFFASLPFLAAALVLASPLHRFVDRFFLPLAVLAVAGAGLYAYFKVAGPAETADFLQAAILLSVVCTAIACLSLYLMRRVLERSQTARR
ncbi:hypothetical protein [Bauldia litoralis]|uniref:Uncharacterized protein n=1 Tax=Bauldia litoralis TaxID=665467 RepID=A0A1G6AYB0_9HYPH|nr:hypothetical protein [Bauldia litoralis]SDB13397.1 hypothetical protein SAMN02982931_01006 [Bauldia litoralis]